jgi:hypothetical protein
VFYKSVARESNCLIDDDDDDAFIIDVRNYMIHIVTTDEDTTAEFILQLRSTLIK